MNLDDALQKYELDFTEKLSEREKMIFRFAYNKGIESMQKEIIEFFNVKVTRHYDQAVLQTVKSVRENLNIECQYTYLTMTFPFYLHYQITIKGNEKEIEQAKKAFNNFEIY